jgi:hypothetical protein
LGLGVVITYPPNKKSIVKPNGGDQGPSRVVERMMMMMMMTTTTTTMIMMIHLTQKDKKPRSLIYFQSKYSSKQRKELARRSPFNANLNCFTSCDKSLIVDGRLLKILITEYKTPFGNTVKFAMSKCKFNLYLVLILCTSELDLNSSAFLTSSNNKKNMY